MGFRLPFTALLGVATLLLTRTPFTRADSPIKPSFPYGTEKVRGVNLGGWLILEPWIVPSLFEDTNNTNIIDEWTFCQLQNRSVAEAALQNHWDTFYSESDFKAMAEAGLNHIRIPIGYWAFEVGPGEPYIQGQLPYLKRVIDWAGHYGLKVMIDLYGAPGSQNGKVLFINSGQILSFPGWPLNATNVNRTKAIVETITDMFVNNTDVVSIIAPLNEPAGYLSADILSVVKQYYLDAYEIIRHPLVTSKQSNTLVLFHDAFQNLSSWDGYLTPPTAQGVALDTHIYQAFNVTDQVLSYQGHIDVACAVATSGIADFDLWVIVGEWTNAITDCAKYLNGRNLGASYDGTLANSTRVGSCEGLSGSASTFNSTYKEFLGKFWEAQTTAYEAGQGWIQWTWKTAPGAGEEWSYEVGLKEGWIPKNATSRKYPNICG
ncbi:hypothetical protein M0805_004371 [Coniferiporia weirii]|nr:hypothetical protein M0805_004371 [Coniferiporia weirii]